MSIRDKLEAKQRRRLVVPIQISDPTQDYQDLAAVAHALGLAKERDAAEDELVSLRSQVDERSEKVQAHWVEVELQALPATDWEVASYNWQTIEVNEDGPTAVMNWPEALPPILAESCVDPGLQDEQWWRKQLAQPHWSEGDLDALRAAILRLNVEAAGSQAPKD